MSHLKGFKNRTAGAYRWAALAGILICALPALASRASAYTILDLGFLPNGYGNSPWGLNAFGEVVGGGNGNHTTFPIQHAFRTGPNSAITAASDLGTLGGTLSVAFGINASGQTVGYSYLAGDQTGHAFRTEPSAPITAASDLGAPLGGSSYARNMNDAGQVVGDFAVSSLANHAFRTSPNGPLTVACDLGTFPGGEYSTAVGINSLGQAVGWSATAIPGASERAFRTDPNGVVTTATDLGTLGGSISRATGINDSGITIGLSYPTGSTTFHAFRTTRNGLITPASDLGTLGGSFSNAISVNNSGQTVGESSVAGTFPSHAFLADMTGPMRDLNDLIPANSGWLLGEATGINDSGQICGIGAIGGQIHAFLLTPIPEPASVALLGFGFLALLVRRRRATNGSASRCA